MMAWLLFCAGTAVSADFGRMFFTPEQRATLDDARKKNLRIEIGTESVQPPAAPAPQNLSVNGIVRRSDGKSTVWLNNRAVTEPRAGDVNVATGKNDNRVKLTDPASGRSVELKVGQTVEIVSGTVQENYVRRPPSKTEVKSEPESGSIPASAAQANAGEPAATSRSRKAAQRRRVIDDLIDAAAAGDQRDNRAPSPDRTEVPAAPNPMVGEPAY
jgi:hypothetical protein